MYDELQGAPVEIYINAKRELRVRAGGRDEKRGGDEREYRRDDHAPPNKARAGDQGREPLFPIFFAQNREYLFHESPYSEKQG